MKSLEEIKPILESHREEIIEKFKVKKIGIFGSYIKGKEEQRSDLDILVELDDSIGLLKFIELENHLSDLLRVKVDLVMKSALKRRIGKHILKEVVYL
ncbi:nucleotidyltransferase family protein [candidate division NPL-UPA2 bacterium]|nr:nucleotidyltransferase family protein [candidate division NPL-UPA2 bacterium]